MSLLFKKKQKKDEKKESPPSKHIDAPKTEEAQDTLANMTDREIIEALLKETREQRKEQTRLTREVWYNRVALAMFLALSLFYIHLQTSRLGDVIGTLIEIFLPNGN